MLLFQMPPRPLPEGNPDVINDGSRWIVHFLPLTVNKHLPRGGVAGGGSRSRLPSCLRHFAVHEVGRGTSLSIPVSKHARDCCEQANITVTLPKPMTLGAKSDWQLASGLPHPQPEPFRRSRHTG